VVLDRHVKDVPVVITDPMDRQVARGDFGGAIRKFGNNPDVGTTEEDLWDGGGTYPWQTAGVALEVISGSAQDGPGGTGALTVEVQGLDDDFALQTVEATLNGDSAVALTGTTWRRVFRVKVLTAGSGGKNVGAITVRVASAGAVQAVITAGRNQTLMAVYTVPAGKVGYLEEVYFGAASNKIVEVALYVRPEGGVFNVKRVFHVFRAPFQYTYPIPLPVAAKSDVVMRATAESAGDPVSAGFTLWYEDA